MNLLTRYVVRIFLRNFLLSIGSFAGIYLLVEFFEKVDTFVERNADITLYFGYFLNAIPLFAAQVAPLAVLMAAFITVGGLSRTGELTAMRAGGMSLFRITRPVIVAAFGITIAVILIQEFVLPASTSTMNRVLHQEVKGKESPQRIRDKLWVRTGNSIVHIDQAITGTGTLQGVVIFDLDKGFRIASRTDAGSAQYRDGGWLFRNLTIRTFDPESGEMTSSQNASSRHIAFNKKPDDFAHAEPLEWELNFADLRKFADKMQEEGYDPTRYLVEMHTHISAPFSCLVMVLLGIPFALQRGRKSSLSSGIVISVMVGVIFFILHSVALAFGMSGVLPPLLATWSANILVGLTGLWLVLFRAQ